MRNFIGFISKRTSVICVLLACAIANPLRAQTNTGAITGTVRDKSQGLLPGVEVKATAVETGNERVTLTDRTGVYSVGFLPPGRYRIEFSLPGLKTLVWERITVNVTERQTLDVLLEVAHLALRQEV